MVETVLNYPLQISSFLIGVALVTSGRIMQNKYSSAEHIKRSFSLIYAGVFLCIPICLPIVSFHVDYLFGVQQAPELLIYTPLMEIFAYWLFPAFGFFIGVYGWKSASKENRNEYEKS